MYYFVLRSNLDKGNAKDSIGIGKQSEGLFIFKSDQEHIWLGIFINKNKKNYKCWIRTLSKCKEQCYEKNHRVMVDPMLLIVYIYDYFTLV